MEFWIKKQVPYFFMSTAYFLRKPIELFNTVFSSVATTRAAKRQIASQYVTFLLGTNPRIASRTPLLRYGRTQQNNPKTKLLTFRHKRWKCVSLRRQRCFKLQFFSACHTSTSYLWKCNDALYFLPFCCTRTGLISGVLRIRKEIFLPESLL
jgi:hypothetical protein